MANPERTGRRGRQAEAAENDQRVLEAARTLVATRGADVSVAAIAEEAGVGIGSLYRRYATKEALFQHLCTVAMEQVADVALQALEISDPWEGLVHYIEQCVQMRTGVLAPLAGTIEVTTTMLETARRSGHSAESVVERAHSAGSLRKDVTSLDISLLIEMLSRRTAGYPPERDHEIRRRLSGIVLDGLRRRPDTAPLPGHPPSRSDYERRWTGPREP